MFIKIIDIISAAQLYENLKKVSLSINTLYKLSRLKKEIDFHLLFYKDNLLKIIEEYGERDDEGKLLKTDDDYGILIKKEKIAICQDKVNDLLNLQIEIPDLFFSLEEFENIEMTLEDFQVLSSFIKEKQV